MSETLEKLELRLKEMKKVEGDMLELFRDKTVIFSVHERPTSGVLTDIGENFLGFKDVIVYDIGTSIEYWLDGSKGIDDEVCARRERAVYNKRDISQMYLF